MINQRWGLLLVFLFYLFESFAVSAVFAYVITGQHISFHSPFAIFYLVVAFSS